MTKIANLLLMVYLLTSLMVSQEESNAIRLEDSPQNFVIMKFMKKDFHGMQWRLKPSNYKLHRIMRKFDGEHITNHEAGEMKHEFLGVHVLHYTLIDDNANTNLSIHYGYMIGVEKINGEYHFNCAGTVDIKNDKHLIRFDIYSKYNLCLKYNRKSESAFPQLISIDPKSFQSIARLIQDTSARIGGNVKYCIEDGAYLSETFGYKSRTDVRILREKAIHELFKIIKKEFKLK